MRILPLACLTLAFGLLACGDDSGGHLSFPDARQLDARPLPDADNGDVPRVEAAACKFTIGASLNLTEGTDYTCGDLVVEENRGTHTGRIRLHFIRIKSTVTTNRATIYLDGGPGGDGQGILDYAEYLGKPFLDGLLVDGDFLVVGQRGTRLSVPFLNCHTDDCSDYAQIADLASYNTAYNADDVDDLRGALGLNKLTIYGISYGSRLGLEVLRRHGDHVRAAVIEGLVPAQVNWPAAVPASAYSAISALNVSCSDAGACGTTFGDLITKFTTGVDALNANAVNVDVGGQPYPLDGYTYAYLVFQMMYSRSSYAYLPLIINDLSTRRTDRISGYLATWLQATGGDNGISTGLYMGVVCGEIYNPPDPNAVATWNTGVPQAFMDIFGGGYPSLEQTCSTYPKGNLQAALAQPVTSAVRTMVSSGRLDPITPPTFGAAAAATLSNSVVVIHANSGHGATLQSACGTQNLDAFLADPDTAHDTSCAGAITTNYVIPSSFASPPAPSLKQIRAELAIAPRLPFPRRRP